jgi:cytochrome c oxidase subunit 2
MENISLLPDASSLAGPFDVLFFALGIASIVVTLGIAFLVIFFAIKYRRGSGASRRVTVREAGKRKKIEYAWTLIPLAIFLGFFYWAGSLYTEFLRLPAGNVIDIAVVGKQWMWKAQHPEGKQEINELHVPLGIPVRLTMISQDVIHSFFVPAFRLKYDVLPRQYHRLWFKPTKLGKYHLFCAEYCGTDHSRMIGWIVVMEPSAYKQWLQQQ